MLSIKPDEAIMDRISVKNGSGGPEGHVHSTHKGEETVGKPVSKEETAPLSIRAPYPKPLVALSQRHRHRSYAGSVLPAGRGHRGIIPECSSAPPGQHGRPNVISGRSLGRGPCTEAALRPRDSCGSY